MSGYTLEPRKLEKGWFHRTFTNAIKLCLRTPISWCMIYIGLPLFSELVELNFGLMILSALVVVIGTSISNQANCSNSVSIKCIFSDIKNNSHFFTLCLTSAAILTCIGYSFKSTDAFFVVDVPFSPPFFSYATNAFLVFMMLSGMAGLISIITVVIKLIHTFSDKPDFDYSLIGLFSVHLVTDMKLPWREASILSEKGCNINMNGLFSLSVVGFISLVFPVLFGLIVPWVYCVYREIYFGQKELFEMEVQANVSMV